MSEVGASSAELARKILHSARVAVKAGSFYGATGEGHLRVCFGAEPYARVDQAMDRIEAWLNQGRVGGSP